MWKSHVPVWTTRRITSSIRRWYPTVYGVRSRGEYHSGTLAFSVISGSPWSRRHSSLWISCIAAASLLSFAATESDNVLNIYPRFCTCEGASPEQRVISSGDSSESSTQTTDVLQFLSSLLQAPFDPGDAIPPLVKEWIQSMTDASSGCSTPDGFQEILLQLFNLVAIAKQKVGSAMEDLQKDHSLSASNDDGISEVVTKFLEAVASQRSLLAQLPSIPSTIAGRSSTDEVPALTYSSTEDTTSLQDIVQFLDTYHDDIHAIVSTYMSEIDYKRITPTAILYYSEFRNSREERSILKSRIRWLEDWRMADIFKWKSLMSNDVPELQILENDALVLSKLAYADTIEEIRSGLNNFQSSCYEYELLDCDLKSSPGQPAHFSAVRRNKSPLNRSSDDTERDVVLVIRGTKSIADAITDVLCDSKPYRNGFAHSHILDSGRYIADKYRPILLNLFPAASKVNVHIYGHSLGAGSGAIAAMELNTAVKVNLGEPTIRATMIGYGCPAILSANLVDATQDYITTVVNDSDLVPRLSGITVTNVLYDIIEFNWLPYAQRDIQYVLSEMQKQQPLLFTNDMIDSIYKKIEPIIASVFHDTYLKHGSIPRRKVELYPPGRCIHLYRPNPDDKGISRAHVPNSFYSTIEVNNRMIYGTYNLLEYAPSLIN
jgi:Lipase (class 3)